MIKFFNKGQIEYLDIKPENLYSCHSSSGEPVKCMRYGD